LKKLLILNQNNPIVSSLIPLLRQNPDIDYQIFSGNPESAGDYIKALRDVDWIFSALGPNDVDLDFEELFDAIDEVQPPISHFVMLSAAGVDDELVSPISYPGVKDQAEFLKQQRYAIKIVDESELPYTIIRLSKLSENDSLDYKLFNEGIKMPNATVSSRAVAKLVLEVFQNNQLVNRSVGVING
jgi:hypothetical protein